MPESAGPASLLEARSVRAGVGSGLDPRTKILLVIVASAAIVGPGGTRFLAAGVVLAVGLAAWERAWRRALWFVVTAAVLAALAFWLPVIWPNPVSGFFSVGALYLVRIAVAAGIGAHLVATTSPTRLAAAFRSWHLPGGISVSFSVMLRFFPLVAGEARGVVDAMRLRGLTGFRGLIRHPVLAVERFTVPIMASSLTVGEDLSASAILRGLGSHHRPSSMDPPRFTWRDAALAACVLALAVASLLIWPEAL